MIEEIGHRDVTDLMTNTNVIKFTMIIIQYTQVYVQYAMYSDATYSVEPEGMFNSYGQEQAKILKRDKLLFGMLAAHNRRWLICQ